MSWSCDSATVSERCAAGDTSGILSLPVAGHIGCFFGNLFQLGVPVWSRARLQADADMQKQQAASPTLPVDPRTFGEQLRSTEEDVAAAPLQDSVRQSLEGCEI